MKYKEFSDGIAFYGTDNKELAFYSKVIDTIEFYGPDMVDSTRPVSLKEHEEIVAKIKEYKKEQKANSVGFKNDSIFLLSIEEYEKYKSKIPSFSCWWWLRSPGTYHYSAAFVSNDGSVHSFGGRYVNSEDDCVRPALKIQSNKDKLVFGGMTWINIDKNLYIVEVPIATKRFDHRSNNYETSEIRKFLLNWYDERKDW